MKKFIVDGQYAQLLQHNHFAVDKVLKRAKLPENLFTQHTIRLTEPEYYSLMNAIEAQAPDQQALLQLATYSGIETFAAPILAAYCSENGLKFIKRLGQYKQLIGPIVYQIKADQETVTVTLQSLNDLPIESKFYVTSELLFLVNLLSQGTETKIKPLKITSTFKILEPSLISDLGIEPTVGTTNRITFKTVDLELPFLTNNEALRDYLTPELKRRLSELEVDESFGAQVRSALVDLLPTGECTIDDVAIKLNISKRTLQRKLKAEKTSFQKQINSVREMLAKNYLKNTTLASDEIAYLLGYLEVNSFLRAFTIWTGMSLSEYRKQLAPTDK
ncbi:helix-turn-helix domain-containing protein [Levilactobacillus bambusae]|uniref:AraC family transcriptional regulator n=1 Tax=Levilactobacillus bambusae TaxID=2024736 RepID=A0A2V1N2L6_9LACO|nr:helix-turn-helix transcriptional regulator [Levilactobacillus bambusae]PWG00390.1 AraC family transcriptional regulator [Levilactobacillus bambusae]